MTRTFIPLLLLLAVALLPGLATAQVLGSCGSDDAQTPGAALQGTDASVTSPTGQVSRTPLPGEAAPNFELIALVGDDFQKIKLSDYDGQWRVVCFYPADFTFV